LQLQLLGKGVKNRTQLDFKTLSTEVGYQSGIEISTGVSKWGWGQAVESERPQRQAISMRSCGVEDSTKCGDIEVELISRVH
jgi:hypothetical protein